MKNLLFALLALGSTSCLNTNPDECHATVTAPASTVSGPKTVAVNQPATFLINYQLTNSCGKPGVVTEQVAGNTHAVTVTVSYEGCNCPQVMVPAQASYTFQPTLPGTYILQFVSANNFITDTLVAK